MRFLLLLSMAAGLTLPARAQDAPAAEALPTLSLSAYVEALDTIRSALDAGRTDEAREAARALRERRVAWAGERLAPDATVLDAVAGAAGGAAERRQSARLRRLVDALREAEGDAPRPAGASPDVLAGLVTEDRIAKGGDVARLRVKPLSFPERVESALLAAYDWVASVVRRIRDWLDRLRPAHAPETANAGRTATVAVVFATAAAILLALLALRTLRRSARKALEVESLAPVVSSRDEDPLSRETSEWERHARDLAAAGRWREAVRAWYHAVLVALFRTGALHYQKGRTNWEYVSRLPPEPEWRPGFIALTRLFDREWYGRRSSDAEAHAECARTARAVLRAVRGAGEAA